MEWLAVPKPLIDHHLTNEHLHKLTDRLKICIHSAVEVRIIKASRLRVATYCNTKAGATPLFCIWYLFSNRDFRPSDAQDAELAIELMLSKNHKTRQY